MGVEASVLGAHDDDAFTGYLERRKRARLLELLQPSGVEPLAGKDRVAFALEKSWVHVSGAG